MWHEKGRSIGLPFLCLDPKVEGRLEMYSPKISEELIPVLYRMAKDKRMPMTQLVNALLCSVLELDKEQDLAPEMDERRVA